MCKALGSIPNMKKRRKEGRKEKENTSFFFKK
jgi:hypothetical protein